MGHGEFSSWRVRELAVSRVGVRWRSRRGLPRRDHARGFARAGGRDGWRHGKTLKCKGEKRRAHERAPSPLCPTMPQAAYPGKKLSRPRVATPELG